MRAFFMGVSAIATVESESASLVSGDKGRRCRCSLPVSGSTNSLIGLCISLFCYAGKEKFVETRASSRRFLPLAARSFLAKPTT